jgi:hypothetical protein
MCTCMVIELQGVTDFCEPVYRRNRCDTCIRWWIAYGMNRILRIIRERWYVRINPCMGEIVMREYSFSRMLAAGRATHYFLGKYSTADIASTHAFYQLQVINNCKTVMTIFVDFQLDCEFCRGARNAASEPQRYSPWVKFARKTCSITWNSCAKLFRTKQAANISCPLQSRNRQIFSGWCRAVLNQRSHCWLLPPPPRFNFLWRWSQHCLKYYKFIWVFASSFF